MGFMMLSLRRNREAIQNLRFEPQEWEKNAIGIINPARGWYSLYPFRVGESIDPSELRWYLKKDESIALVMLDLGAYRERELDESALSHIVQILDFFCQYQKDVILRPVYDTEGRGIEHEPEKLELLLRQMEQIGNILQGRSHSVFLFQGLLIGSWGEMHNSKFLSEEALRTLYAKIRDFLGSEICLAVRTPAIWRTLISEEDYRQGNYQNLTLFNDALFSSRTDMGTFGFMTKEAAGWSGAWMRSEELAFENKLCERLPYGGEVVLGEEKTLSSTINEMRKIHLSYLNRGHDLHLLNQWKEKTWEDNEISFYDYVSEHMGYRFVVSHPNLTLGKGIWHKYILSFDVENEGFGVCWQNTGMVVCVESDVRKQEIALSEDLSDWRAGERKTLSVPIEPMAGRVYLTAKRKKDGAAVKFANENTGRLFIGSLCWGN